jgi:hypothetical protein
VVLNLIPSLFIVLFISDAGFGLCGLCWSKFFQAGNLGRSRCACLPLSVQPDCLAIESLWIGKIVECLLPPSVVDQMPLFFASQPAFTQSILAKRTIFSKRGVSVLWYNPASYGVSLRDAANSLRASPA